MTLTRRQLVTAAAAGAAAIPALAQQPSTAAARDFAKESKDGVDANRATLAKFQIPMSTEPAFHFKA